jgi:N-acetylmuramoyl-L-alanine amidase
MKKFVSMLMLVSLLFTVFAAVGQAAETVPKLFLNGKVLTSEVSPKIVTGNRIVVPLRVISEQLGYHVGWEAATKKITVDNSSTVIELKLNEDVATVNGQSVKLDVPAVTESARTLVPIRFVSEQLGLKVEWKQTEKEVHISDIPKEPEVPGGLISDIAFDGISSIKISYTGTVKINEPLYLDGGKRIVFDFPGTGYATPFSGEVKTATDDHPLLVQYRYAQFSLSPLTARLVLEVAEGISFTRTESEGAITLNLLPAGEKPVDPETPVQPETPDGTETPEDPATPTDPTAPSDPPATEPGNSSNTGVYNIVIDAGHGGKDPGAASVLKKTEKEFNLSIALKIKALLDKETQIKGHLTRSNDTFLELDERVAIAEKLKADLFISIHANAINKPSVSGTETYYSRASSKAFADVIHKHLLKGTGLKDRGVKQADYRVIKKTTMPAILLEAGYLTNTTDSQALYSEAVQNRIAEEVVAGIKEYLKLK